jgi:hypothetical protein
MLNCGSVKSPREGIEHGFCPPCASHAHKTDRVGRKEPSYTAGGNVNLCNHSGKKFGGYLEC